MTASGGVMQVIPLVAPEGDLEWERPVGYHFFSPTQISEYLECERKWAWRRIAHIKVAPKPSAALGTRVHSVLEQYLRDGVRPDFVKDREAAEIASSGLHFLPEPKTPGMLLEREFRFQSPRTSFVYGGLKDVEIKPGVVLSNLEFDGAAPIVIDHKTTKSINDYAKSKDDLLFDAQSTLYAYDSMARFEIPVADLAWVYYQTKGAKRASPTTLRLESSHAARVFDAIEKVATEMATALDKQRTPLELVANTKACGAYGGCPYAHLCTDLSKSPASIIRKGLKHTMSTIADLRARVQSQAAPTPSTPAPAPETPQPSLFGDPTKLPAVTEIPKALLGDGATASVPDHAINPPESKLPPPMLATSEPAHKTPEEIAAEGPQTTTGRRRGRPRNTPPAAPADPKAADFHAAVTPPDVVASNGAEKASVSGVVEAMSKEIEDTVKTIAVAGRSGFTLYVDCMPIGRAAKTMASFIASAQERMLVDGPRDAAGQPVPDYRLVDYGKGVPAFVSFVLDQLDGRTDLVLDTRSPEGAVLLEPLMARASFVVRGIR